MSKYKILHFKNMQVTVCPCTNIKLFKRGYIFPKKIYECPTGT